MADLFDLLGNSEDTGNWKESIPELEKVSGKDLKWLYKCDYRFVKDIDDLYALRDYLVDKPYIALDTETTGVLYLDKTVSIQLSAEPGISYFIPIRMEQCANITPQQFVEVIGPELQKDTHTLLAFNFKFDGLRLNSLISINKGIYLFDNNIKVIDLQICFKLQDPDTKLTLKLLTKKKLNRDQLELENLFKRTSSKKAAIKFQSLPIVHAIPYACADTDTTLQIYLNEKAKIDSWLESDQIIQLEHKVQKVIARMEINGCYINKALLAKANVACDQEIDRLDKLIKAAAGDSFQVNSVAQMQEFLYGSGPRSLGLQPTLFTDKGAPAVNKDALAQYKDTVSVVDYILKYKEACKLKSAFLEKIPSYCDSNGCVHPNFNPLGAASGRFSCTDPNFQQLPKQKDSELDFRSAVRNSLQARPGYILFDMDYSQVEYRVFAQLCGDEHLQKAYADGADFHQATAAIAYKVPYDKVTPLQRKRAKTINFGLLYGLSTFGLAQKLDCSEAEAAQMMEDYFAEKPRVREWQAEVQSKAVEKKYVKTVFGRRRLLRELYSKDRGVYNSGLRKSVNSTVQGSAADILKIAFVRLQKCIDEKWPEVMMTATVHDEILFEVPLKYDLRQCFADLKDAMQVQPAGWVVPIVAEPEVGFYWGSIVDIKDFDYDHPESLKDASIEVHEEDVKEKIDTLTFILPEKMAQISFMKFKKLIADNPGETEFDLVVGSGQPKRAKSKIALTSELVGLMEDLYITVKVPDSLLMEIA